MIDPRRQILELGPVTTGYGAPAAFTGKPHDGVDVSIAAGTEIPAPVGGRLVEVLEDPIGGLQAVVETPDGFRQVFAHLTEIVAAVGAALEPGDVVARSGQSGLVTGPHLHYAVYAPGQGPTLRRRAVDPRVFLGEFAPGGGPSPRTTAPARAPDVNPVTCLLLAATVGGGPEFRDQDVELAMRLYGFTSREEIRRYALACAGVVGTKSAPEKAIELAAGTLASLRDPATWGRVAFSVVGVALITAGVILYASSMKPAVREALE